MADPSTGAAAAPPWREAPPATESRRGKRMAMKKLKRKQARREAAIREREEAEAHANDPEERLRAELRAREEAEAAERERRAFEEHERLWLAAAAARKKAEEERRQKLLEEEERYKTEHENEIEEGDDWEYVEDGPAEIIWQGNEIIVKKKKTRVPKRSGSLQTIKEDDDRPTSNPFPPQSAAFASYRNAPPTSAREVLESTSQQIPNFGTEQDKTHCPFHLKTGACRFGSRCSRVHFHPDKSCTLLIKNMYSGPGLAWEQDEGLECTDEEVEWCYEEFYEDVHTEFLKFGELVNFKVCRNGSYHLRGNVYVHYKSLDSAILAYSTMNGRYFAGKQIICEFIGVTRWKVAICGEFMKSRLKACSRGTACNFIHCFRNPGGDYEWADWDNPPPKHWIKKMAALFGPSNESGYGKNVELEAWERPSDMGRKNTPTNYRHLSRTPYNERNGWNTDSDREDADRKKVRRFISREHYKRRKETNILHKRRRSEENHNFEVHDFCVKCFHGHDLGEDSSKEKDRDLDKKHKKYDELNSRGDRARHKRKHRTKEDRISKEESYIDERIISEKKYKSKSHKRYDKGHISDWNSDCSDDKRDPTEGRSSGKPYETCTIDSQERYDGRRYLGDDLGSDRDTYGEKASRGSSYSDERKESDQYDSHRKRKHTSLNPERDHKKGRVREHDATDCEFVNGESTDHRGKKQKHSSRERSRDCSPDDGSGRSVRQIDPDKLGNFVEDFERNRDKEHKKHSRKSRKGKHSQGRREYKGIEEDISFSDSHNLYLNKKAHRTHSRSCSPVLHSGNTRRERELIGGAMIHEVSDYLPT